MAISWEIFYKNAEKLYGEGRYWKAFLASTMAKEQLSEKYSLVLRKRAWSARHVGYKNPGKREEMYEIAKNDAGLILQISEDVEVRNSAIKLLILLPEQNVAELCAMGIEELKESALDHQKIIDMTAELKNSLGIEVGKQYPEEAIKTFLDAYETVTKRTTIAGHLLHNAGSHLLKVAEKENDFVEKEICLKDALSKLKKALEEYPLEQKGHRDAVEKKIKSAESRIEAVSRQIEEENK